MADLDVEKKNSSENKNSSEKKKSQGLILGIIGIIAVILLLWWIF